MGSTGSLRVPCGPGSWSYRFFDALRRRLNRRLVRYLTNTVILKDESFILEGGSGPGYASSLLAAQNKVRLSVAADIDLAALREARRRDPTLPVVRADLYHLSFRSGAFDLVWNSSTMEHVRSPADALGEMRRVVKDGGYVFVGVPYRFGPLGFQPWIKETRFGAWIGPVFDRPRLVRLMVEQGLKPVAIITYFFKFFIGIVARKSLGLNFSDGERWPGGRAMNPPECLVRRCLGG